MDLARQNTKILQSARRGRRKKVQRLRKEIRRIFYKGKLIGEYTEQERDEFSKKMHEFMLVIGNTAEQKHLEVHIIQAMRESDFL
jgi:hypothetical protein